jgi:hypothetical protein
MELGHGICDDEAMSVRGFFTVVVGLALMLGAVWMAITILSALGIHVFWPSWWPRWMPH